MFKPTPLLLRDVRRLALTTKQAGNQYYKGNRTGAMGEHTRFGTYRIHWDKMRTYVVPPGLQATLVRGAVLCKMQQRRTKLTTMLS